MTFAQSLDVAILAHGGEMTGDEMALVGGGLAAAVLFPAAVLFFVIRKSNRDADPDSRNAGSVVSPDVISPDVISPDHTANLVQSTSTSHRHSSKEQP